MGKGLVLHIAPSNMPAMFAYSWAASLLCGNANIVRLPSGTFAESKLLLHKIGETMALPAYWQIGRANRFVQFDHDDALLTALSDSCAARVFWGSDATVSHLTTLPKPDGCTDLCFPDRYSVSLLDVAKLDAMTEDELRQFADRFYRDTYQADQNACSSPKVVFWLRDRFSGADDGAGSFGPDVRRRFWELLSEAAARYDLTPHKVMEKYRMLCCNYAKHGGLLPVQRYQNRLWVVPAKELPKHLFDLEAAYGLFYEYEVKSVSELLPWMESKIQTVTVSDGFEITVLQRAFVRLAPACRVVPVGEALEFSLVWDGVDLMRELSK